jgi:hypothetical protein
MLPRLLPLLCLLFLPHASLTQQESGTAKPASVPDTCSVTKFSDKPFVPPYPYPAKLRLGVSWFGSDGLWIIPPSPNGEIQGLREKMGWWRQGYDWRTEPTPKLKVTGRRLDSQAPPVAVDGPDAVGVSGPPRNYMMVGLTFPTPGCWEITGHDENDELTFIVWVTK